MKHFWIIVLLVAYFARSIEAVEFQYAPTVQLTTGQVRGRVVDVLDTEKKVYFYEAIRYGRAERFEKPKPVEPWTGIYNATEMGYDCPMTSHPRKQSEDCLFLNVWLPESQTEKNRTVIVWLHGGAYATGSIFDHRNDGRYLASGGDLIFVSVAYRLGALGFMTTEKVANFGLYDPILALKWVQDNIGAFGGNAQDVTIMGESAGAFTVAALILSPLTKGLFHRAITQSGSVLGISSLQHAQLQTQHLATRLHCPTEPLSAAVKCLKTVPIGDLLANGGGAGFYSAFGEEVLPLSPIEALKSGQFNHVDLLYGANRNDGTSFVAHMFDKGHDNNMTVESTKRDLEDVLKSSGTSSQDIYKIVQFYMSQLGSNPTQDSMKTIIADAIGDSFLICSTVLFAEEMAQIAPNRAYFSYRLMQNTDDHLTWKGVQHGSDIAFLFEVDNIRAKPAATQLSRDMIKAWTSFAKTGHPGMMGTVEWESAFVSNTLNPVTRYMHLESANYHLFSGYYKDRCDKIWKDKITGNVSFSLWRYPL